MGKSILLMYISEHSGHHQATLALEKAILEKDPSTHVSNINAFRYMNPVMEKVTHETYMRIIKKRPEIWGYLYDNPRVVKKTGPFRKLVRKRGSRKIGRLINRVKPDAIACTQAFPCELAAEYKKMDHAKIPLMAVLTDYAPHSYWIHKGIDVYIVPSPEIGGALVKKGVSPGKIKALGTPIDPLFEIPLDRGQLYDKLGLSPKYPVILVMGGTYGIGPDEKLITALDSSQNAFQVLVVAGVNKKLFKRLKSKAGSYRKKIIVLGFTRNIHELMEVSDIIITKPGGLTMAEALAKSLPVIILNPLPGQEDLNTKILTRKGIAVKAHDEHHAVKLAEELAGNPNKIKKMQEIIGKNATPHSAANVAEYLLNLAN